MGSTARQGCDLVTHLFWVSHHLIIMFTIEEYIYYYMIVICDLKAGKFKGWHTFPNQEEKNA
ncbi:hypothetical protein GCM10010911_57450 [Paenibacillus nasutitermitis]|uniref:Uncharacterized protein n=1 Tax=Paenibacillus nasutitermitis TaxID=1652958 RepID=A0A916ZE43_9BACL|nr:hypothetical protein GCM10010911_57450 [Paenibacillus nasutitermitis]